MKEINIITLGCRLNKAESDEIASQLQTSFRITQNPKADIFIINTCSVTSQAFRRSFKAVSRVKEENPGARIVICGCAAEDIEKEGLTADLVFSKVTQAELSKKIIHLYGQDNKIVVQADSTYARPLVKIQDGCNNFCTYCIVPYLRGREASRPAKDILDTVRSYEQNMYSEVVLSGVNIGQYRYDGHGLAELLTAILEETESLRIRLSSINPDDFDAKLIALFANPRLCAHVHLSLQSGSDGVLKRMNRKYTAADYAKVVAGLRTVRPEIAVTTDVVVGFPGETDAEFEECLRFVEDLHLAKVHVFRYSKREGTVAARMAGQIPEKTKKERSSELIARTERQEAEFYRDNLGKDLEVVFESKNKGLAKGISSNYLNVYVQTNQPLRKTLRKVRAIEAAGNKIFGSLEA